MGLYHDTNGEVVEVDDAYAQGRGLQPVTEAEEIDRSADRGQGIRDDNRGFLGTLNAAATSALSGATLGLSDVALGAVMTEGEREALRGDRHANKGVSTAANIVGGLATSIAAPGSMLARTPAGAVAQVANRGVAAGRAAGGVGGAARVAAYSGAEAAAQSAGSYLSDVALGDRELTAEGMAGALGRGFAFGAVAGGALYGVERGTIAARRLFPKVGATKAVEAAETTWKIKSTEIFDAHDATAEIARKRIEEANAAIADATANQARIKAEIAELRAKPRAPVEAPATTPATLADGPPTPAALADDAAPPPALADAPAPAAIADKAAPFAAPPKAAADVPLTLESQLAEMQKRVDGGASLQDLNAARKATPQQAEQLQEALTEYQTARQKVDAWVERLRNPRVEHHGINYEGANNALSGFGRVRKTLATDVPVEQSGGQLRIVGAKENSLDSLTPNSRLLGADVVPDRSLGVALDEEYHELIDMARTSATIEERAFALSQAAKIEDQIHSLARGNRPEVDAVLDRIEALRSQHGRTSLSSAEQRLARQQARYEKAGEKHMLPAPAPHPAIPRQPTRKPDVPAEAVPKPPSTVDEVAEAAEVIGEYEKAAAKLTDAVDDAPKAAKDARDELRKATDDSERKATDRTARAVDDHVSGMKPKRAKRQSDPQMDALRAERAQADAALARAKSNRAAAESDLAKPRPEPAADPAAAVSLPAVPGAVPSDRFGTLADVGAVLEAADTIGIPGLPSPSSLPVVGPLLGMYLKFRAVKAIAGRMTGRVPATGDARAAAAAAKTKDKAIAAVDRLLGFVERATPTARNLAVRGGGRLVDALSKPLTDDAEPVEKNAPLPQLAAARARELSNAVANPQSIIARVRGELAEIADPDLIAAAEQFELRKIDYLHKHAPKEPPSGPLTKRQWTPTMAESTKFARRVEVADDPIAALEAVESRSITTEQADALRTLYPRLFASCQERLIERTAEITQTVPRDQRFRLSLLFDVPLDRLLEPDKLALLQSSSSSANATTSPAAPTQPPVPSIAGPVDLTALYTTPSDRRAARR